MTALLSHPLVALAIVLLSIFILIKSADYLVEGASSVAKVYGLSDIFIGLTIVAFGTSFPEMFITIFASVFSLMDAETYVKMPNLAIGTIIGSNIFNTMFVLGIAGFIHSLNCKKPTVWREIPMSLGITLLFFVLVNDTMFFGSETGDSLSRIDSIIMLIGFVAFFYFIIKSSASEDNSHLAFPGIQVVSAGKAWTYIIVSVLGLTIGTILILSNIHTLAKSANISYEFLGLTLLAFGTSLPELSTAAVASFRRKADFAMASVVGSNIFNLLFILPIGGLVNPMPFDPKLDFDLYCLMGGTALLFIAMFTGKKKKLDQWEAFILLAAFFVYLIYIIFRDTTPGVNS